MITRFGSFHTASVGSIRRSETIPGTATTGAQSSAPRCDERLVLGSADEWCSGRGGSIAAEVSTGRCVSFSVLHARKQPFRFRPGADIRPHPFPKENECAPSRGELIVSLDGEDLAGLTGHLSSHLSCQAKGHLDTYLDRDTDFSINSTT
jgi:hypothetical protein